jgi:hypothetical protein
MKTYKVLMLTAENYRKYYEGRPNYYFCSAYIGANSPEEAVQIAKKEYPEMREIRKNPKEI